MFNQHRNTIINIINKRIDHNYPLYVSDTYKGAIVLVLDDVTYRFKFSHQLTSKFTLSIMVTCGKFQKPVILYRDFHTLDVALNYIVSTIQTHKLNGIVKL